MFETALLSNRKDSKRGWGTLAGFAGQAVVVTLAVMAPMIWPAALPHAVWLTSIEPPGPPAPPPAPPEPGPKFAPKPARPFQMSDTTLRAPVAIPPRPIDIVEAPPEVAAGPYVQGGTGSPGGSGSGSLLTSILSSARPPAPVPHVPEPAPPKPRAPEPTVTKPVRVTSSVELAHPISRIDPVYPQLARQMHIQGVVELQGVLGTDGRIHELKVLRGHPLLIKAAVDAVMQWVYSPTILNGQPVEVQAPITVTFLLR